jgi:catalase
MRIGESPNSGLAFSQREAITLYPGENAMAKIGSVAASACLMVAASLGLTVPSVAQAPGTDTIVEIMRKNAGPVKARPSGAKGQCFTGRFVSTAEGRALTKSTGFRGDVEALIRFSVGGGNPKVPDATKTVNRGLSIRLDPNGPGQTEFVVVNAPVNFVKSPAQMLAFLQARLPGADGKPDAEKIKAFTDANPETTNQGRFLAAQPVVGSWLGVRYWGIHPYTFTNAAGAKQIVKFRFEPEGGMVTLTDDEAKAKPADYLVDEIKARIAGNQPLGLNVMAIPGTAEDAKLDATVQWPNEDSRPAVKVGTLRVVALVDNARCDDSIFDPTLTADGLAGPTDDPLFMERSPAYAISIGLRM